MSKAGATSPRPAPGPGTRSVHPPRPVDQAGTPVAPTLVPSSTFAFSDASSFATASESKVGAGYVYTRWANPTVDAFEAAVADLEGAEEGEAFSSGMAAILSTLLALCDPGDRIVATRQLYGQTHFLLSERLPSYGFDVHMFDVDELDAIARALPARVLFCETIGNPRVQLADLEALSSLAARTGTTFVVDNTFASPILCRPLEFGATAVVHSATKYLGGHHDLIGGVACSTVEVIDRIRAVTRDLGPTMSPFDAWLALRGMQTLHLRVARSSESALRIARHLSAHPEIEAVHYPGLNDPSRAERITPDGGGGTLGFDVAAGHDRARRFQDGLRVVSPAASLGGTHSLIVHAASVTHTQLSPEELAAAGISEGFCRLSVGLEDVADLIADIDAALEDSAA